MALRRSKDYFTVVQTTIRLCILHRDTLTQKLRGKPSHSHTKRCRRATGSGPPTPLGTKQFRCDPQSGRKGKENKTAQVWQPRHTIKVSYRPSTPGEIRAENTSTQAKPNTTSRSSLQTSQHPHPTAQHNTTILKNNILGDKPKVKSLSGSSDQSQ